MRRHVDILTAVSKKHLHYSLFVKRIVAIEAQLYFLGLVGLQAMRPQSNLLRFMLKVAFC